METRIMGKNNNLTLSKIINKMNDLLDDSDFIEKYKKAAKDFTRNRSLPFKTVFRFIMSSLKDSVQSELDYFFGRIEGADTDLHEVTNSALTQARAKLEYTAFNI